jgi:hypothetical protein
VKLHAALRRIATGAAAVLSLACPAALPAQQAAAGTIAGTIVDARTALPLAGAAVTLDRGGAPIRSARSDSAGGYRFDRVAEGQYHLRVQRIGYRGTAIEVVLRGPAESRVSLGLEVQPLALEPVHARGSHWAPAAGGFAAKGDAGQARVAVERLRQAAYLAADVRSLTRADVEEAVPLAEADLLRGLQRLPGVSARDDYAAGVWTRGAPWDHTRVYWDGVPVYNPVHTLGIFSSIDADAVGSVHLHPGVQPAWSGGGAAAVLDVRSRRGGASGPLSVSAEASLASLHLAADGATADGRHAWMIAARRSYSGFLTETLEARTADQDEWVTSGFRDVAARYDLRLGGEAAFEASGLWQHDGLRAGPDAEWVGGGQPGWGNLVGQATLYAPLLGARGRLSVGASHFDARAHAATDTAQASGTLFSWPALFASTTAVRHATVEGRVDANASPGSAPAWGFGAGMAEESAAYEGAPPLPADLTLPPTTIDRDGSLRYGFAWGEARWKPAGRLTVEGAMRVEGGASVPRGGAVRWAPRATARLALTPSVTLSAGAARGWQYLQAGPAFGPAQFTQHLWLLAGGDVPALRSDVASAGGEAWLGPGWLASLNAYARRSDGAALLDPAPGDAVGRPVFVAGRLAARGVEAEVRRLSGRVTGSAAYSWGVSRTRAAGLDFASEADQRHSLDLAVRSALARGFSAGAAFTGATGGAFSRFYGGIALCPLPGAPCEWQERPAIGRPGALRASGYASLDLSADWARAFGRLRVEGFAQLHNALGRENPARYDHSIHYTKCGSGAPVDGETACTVDVWSRGLPRLPVAGVRVEF